MIKNCKICGKEFDSQRKAQCCSDECMKKNRQLTNQKYFQNNKESRFENLEQICDWCDAWDEMCYRLAGTKRVRY